MDVVLQVEDVDLVIVAEAAEEAEVPLVVEDEAVVGSFFTSLAT